MVERAFRKEDLLLLEPLLLQPSAPSWVELSLQVEETTGGYASAISRPTAV